MKILILGANGKLGSIFYKHLSKNIKNKIITTSTGTINYSSKLHKKIDLKKNLNKVLKLISKEKFNLIINCLFIRNNNNEYDIDIPKQIIIYINRKKYKNILWLEIGSYSIFLKHKTNYVRNKIIFENFLKKKYRNNLSDLKIIRIGNFLNSQMMNKLNFLNTKKYQFVLSNKKNIFFLSDYQMIKQFFDKFPKNKKIEINLVKRLSLENIFSLINEKDKKIIFLNINEKILIFFKQFLHHKYNYKLLNLLNLFYSK